MTNTSPKYQFLPFITGLYITLSQVSYVLAYKIISFKTFLLPAGIIVFLYVYTISDIVAEVYGYKRAIRLVWESLICGLIFTMAITFLLKLPSNNSEIYNEVLGKTWRIYAGVALGVTIGSFINLYLFSKWKIWVSGRYFMLRCFISTSIGEAIVTLLTDSIAFFGTIPTQNILKIVFTIYTQETSKCYVSKS